jgi:hypothetical protein
MSDRLKRILLIVGFVLFAAALAAAIWFVFFRPAAVPPGPAVTTPPGAGGVLPGAGSAQPGQPAPPEGTVGLPPAGVVPGAVVAPEAVFAQTTLLRDGVTQGVTASADGSGARYYNPDDGKFYRVSPDGTTSALSSQAFPDVSDVTWGNSSDQAILEFPDGNKVHYDFRTQTQATLPKHWESFNFSGDDRQVVAKSVGVSPDARYLIVSDPDGKNPVAVEPLGSNDRKTFPVWTPNNQIIAYAEVGDPQGLDRQQIILVGKNHENFRGLEVEGRGFMPLWSPDGKTILYSVWSAASDYRPELWVSGGDPDTINKNRTKLDLMTWANKCAWAGSGMIYCAVPDSLPSAAGLQPDLFTNIPDSFYRIDLRTGQKTYLGRPEGGASVRQPVLTDDGAHILFTDARDGRLYDFQIQ